MSCCERKKIDRLKDFDIANVVCYRDMKTTGVMYALVIFDSIYGKYYKSMTYEKAIKEGREVIVSYKAGGRIKKRPKKVAKVL